MRPAAGVRRWTWSCGTQLLVVLFYFRRKAARKSPGGVRGQPTHHLLGYLGEPVVTSIKKPRNGELPPAQKDANKQHLSGIRAAVERCISHPKKLEDTP